jgi:polyisoprenoid-binding protein YceI
MSSAATHPFSGTYQAQPVASTFAFAVRHSGVFWYRGALSDVTATLSDRGVMRSITATGHYAEPRPSSFGEIAGLELHASFDRRQFGFEWQMQLPGGGEALGWNVQLDIDLLLTGENAAA